MREPKNQGSGLDAAGGVALLNRDPGRGREVGVGGGVDRHARALIARSRDGRKAGAGYAFVSLDLEGFATGRMNRLVPVEEQGGRLSSASPSSADDGLQGQGCHRASDEWPGGVPHVKEAPHRARQRPEKSP